MTNGYDKFFKQAQKAAGTAKKPSVNKAKMRAPMTDRELAETSLRKTAKKSKSRKLMIPWKMATLSFVGTAIAYFGLFHYEEVEAMISKVEIGFISGAVAEEVKAPVKKEAPKEPSEADTVAAAAEAASAPADKKSFSEEELNHFARLNERKAELDRREEELTRIESELSEQKVFVEKRMTELEENRRQISSILDEKVKKDEAKIDALVQVYSNMKPSQAAKVIETLDEDLAVEVLGKMKKKNAADILNLIKPEKAQMISEKYTGFRK